MNIEIKDELIIDAVAAATERVLLSEGFIDRVADAVVLRFEALTPAEAAKFLDVTTRTLGENHVQWGLDKSVALGQTNPRYFLSQIIHRLQQKVIAGSRPQQLRSAA